MSEIILATKQHLSEVAEIEKKMFSEPWSEKSLELCLSDNAFCICCVENGAVVSYCTVMTVLDEAQIINVATDPERRGRGYAKAVLETVFAECKKRNLISISLEVRESNVPAIALYEGLSFNVEGKRKDFYKNPRENALVMIKNLV